MDTLHPKIVCTIAEGSVKNGIYVGGRKAIKLQLVQKRVQIARPQYARVVMPSRDRPKHSAYAVGPKARLHPDSVAVGIPRIESLLRICILLSPRSARIIAAGTRVCNVAVIDRIINECKSPKLARSYYFIFFGASQVRVRG